MQNPTTPPSPLADDSDAKLPAAAYLRYENRADGWSAGRQAAFLAHLADNGVVADAARSVGKALSGGYALRRTARGYAFNLGWEAALIIARRIVADNLMAAAIKGEQSRWVREDGITTYTRQNTKLSLTLLDRVNPATTLPEVMAVATRFDCFLQMIDDGLSAQELWDYFFDDALPHSEHPARARVRASLLLSEESTGFEGDEEADEDEAPIEYKSMDGPPSLLAKMPALHQRCHDAGRDHQDTAIIQAPDRITDPARLCQRPHARENQQVRRDECHRAQTNAISRKIAVPGGGGHACDEQRIDRRLHTHCAVGREKIGDVGRKHKNRHGKQFLAQGRAHAPVPQKQDKRDDMANGKGNRAPNHVEFQKPVAQCPKCHDGGQQQKIPAMVLSQGIGHKKSDTRHFPCDRRIIGQRHLP
jgi:hypothetical protein